MTICVPTGMFEKSTRKSTRSVTPIWNWVTVSDRVLVAAVGADDPHRHAVRQADVVEALVGGVEHPEAVEVPLHVHVRPDLAVDHVGVAVDEQHPVRIDVGVRAQRAGRLILRLRIEDLPSVLNERSWTIERHLELVLGEHRGRRDRDAPDVVEQVGPGRVERHVDRDAQVEVLARAADRSAHGRWGPGR